MKTFLVIQGAGMNMRGKTQVEIFGPSSLAEINSTIEGYARELDVHVQIFHSNIEGEVANALYAAHDAAIDACIINPGGFTSETLLANAIAQVRYPTIEVHMSNPAARGRTSLLLPVCKGTVVGFGTYGYRLALDAAKHLAA